MGDKEGIHCRWNHEWQRLCVLGWGEKEEKEEKETDGNQR